MDTCAKGTFLLTRACLPDMLANRHGTVINIASQAARHGYARASVYCAAKFAVLGFARALREEVQHQGIRVHTLCPGLVQVPPPACPGDRKPGWLQVEDLAEAVLYTLRQPASRPARRDRHDGDLSEAPWNASKNKGRRGAPCSASHRQRRPARKIRQVDGG